jgi:tetratricopeptide (TPR) repeat protein
VKTGPALVLLLLLASAPASTQNVWVLEWLRDYAAGGHAEVASRLRTVSDLRRLEQDLEKVSKAWLGKGSIDTQRRALAAFALEAAFARVDQGPAAAKLVEWGCRQIRRLTKPGEFEHRWHLAAFAVFGGAVNPDGLRGHLLHVKLQFPTEPRLSFERAVAAEVSAAEFVTAGRIDAEEITKRNTEAARSYREATGVELPGLREEAWLRLGKVELQLGRPDEALAAFDQATSLTTDPALRYLASLFRGQAYERLSRAGAAREAYEAALGLKPGAHSATMALAALLFRQGDRERAGRLVEDLLNRVETADDPWWLYWPADYRYGPGRFQAMRQALK